MKTPLEFFIFLLYPWSFQTKQSSTSGYSTKLCWKFQGQKQRPLEIPYYLFLVTLGNSTSFLINPWKSQIFENPGIFHFFYFTSGSSRQNKAQPLAGWIFHKIVLDPLEIPRPKTKTPGNSTHIIYFLVTLGNSTLFLINHWKVHMLFL